MKRILLSTKLKTTNIGNQALSDELIKLASEFESDEVKFKLTGRPFGLDKYTYAYFGEKNPIEKFENIAQAIAKKGLKLDSTEFRPSNLKSAKTDLLDVEGFVVKTERLRKIVRNIRKFIYSFFLFSNVYKSRLQLYKNIDYYLYSGAGEVGPTEFFLRQLLDLRVAQIMGVKTCAINQSVEFPKGLSQEILVHVYSKMHKIVVRGDISKKILIDLGVNPDIMYVSPDTAFRTQTKYILKQNLDKRIGINFTPITFNKDQVIPFLKNLSEKGYEMTFISNAPEADRVIAESIKEVIDIEIDLTTMDYVKYSESMNKFDFVISSRLHTNELALTSCVPIIPIEGKVHKTQDVFGHVNYPIKAVKFNDSDYGTILLERVNELEKNYFIIQSWIHENLNDISNKTEGHIKTPIL
jgi:polysaccharide pyruvyl transferase WcaK-like protein